MDDSILFKFFGNMAERLSQENHLSDITASIIKTIPELGIELFKFMTGMEIEPGPVEILREYQLGDGNRIDFVLKCGDNALFLENKIWDRNYHFKEYSAALKGLCKSDEYKSISVLHGLISNHRLDPVDLTVGKSAGFYIRYWNDFVNHLSEAEEFKDSSLITAYIKYVKVVCSMVDIGEVRLDKGTLVSLVHLNNLISTIIDEYRGNENFEYGYYKAQRACSHTWDGCYWMGHYYSIKDRKTGSTAWAFMGLLVEGSPRIQINLDFDWNSDLIKRMNKYANHRDEFYYIVINEDGLGFFLNEDKYNTFNESNFRQQKSILCELFNHANHMIEEFLGAK